MVLADERERRLVVACENEKIGDGGWVGAARCCVGRNRPVHILSANDGVAGYGDQSSCGTRHGQVARGPHRNLVLGTVVAEIQNHFAVAAGGHDIANGTKLK